MERERRMYVRVDAFDVRKAGMAHNVANADWTFSLCGCRCKAGGCVLFYFVATWKRGNAFDCGIVGGIGWYFISWTLFFWILLFSKKLLNCLNRILKAFTAFFRRYKSRKFSTHGCTYSYAIYKKSFKIY